MASEQWVNLTKKDLFKTDGITSKADMGDLRVRFEMKASDLAAFKVKVSLKAGFAEYSDAEKGRNPNFGFGAYYTAPAMNDGKSKGTMTQPITLAAAGGNEYEITAKYKDKEVTGSLTVETRRRLYFQVMAMRGVTAPDLSSMMDTFWGESDKLYIDMQKVGGPAEVPNIGCITKAKGQQFIDACKPVYALRQYKPFAFAVCFIEHYAKIAVHPLARTFRESVPSVLSNALFDGLTLRLTLPPGTYLWKDIDPTDDARRHWGGTWPSVKLVDRAGNEIGNLTSEIQWVDAVRDGVGPGTYGGKYNAVEIKMKSDAIRQRSKIDSTVRIQVRWNVNVVDGFVNGVSYNSTNLVAVASRIRWEDRDVAGMEQTIVHEVGHKIGMVPTGAGSGLDAHPQQYTQRTHTGSHCGKGANWNGTVWSGSPICVMFGSSWASRKGKFCPICAPLVRKLDLSGPTLQTTGFKDSL